MSVNTGRVDTPAALHHTRFLKSTTQRVTVRRLI